MSAAMKEPGPAHPITITPAAGRVRVRFVGRVVADTTRALELREASYPPVYYIPRDDTEMALLAPSNLTTHCPYKGDASYFSIGVEAHVAKDAVWTYDTPYPAVAAIAGYLAFYPDRVDEIAFEPR